MAMAISNFSVKMVVLNISVGDLERERVLETDDLKLNSWILTKLFKTGITIGPCRALVIN